MDLPTRGNYKREKVPKYGAQQRLFTSRNAQKTGSDTHPFRQVPQHFQASPLQRWSHNSVIMIRLLILLLLLLLFNGTSSAATVIFPDCKDTIVGPLCSVGGTIINPASANPVSITGAIVPLSSGSAPTIGWRYISSPLTNNFAISLYSTSAGSSSLFPTQACKNLVYSDLTTPGQGTVWAVLSLHLPADGAVTSTQVRQPYPLSLSLPLPLPLTLISSSCNTRGHNLTLTPTLYNSQPIVGIFGNATAACPLLYTLPTGIVGGPIYAYTGN